jgi:hypothetical protein
VDVGFSNLGKSFAFVFPHKRNFNWKFKLPNSLRMREREREKERDMKNYAFQDWKRRAESERKVWLLTNKVK